MRAVAILPVLLYHLAFRFTPGGFVGVDVFFVISGYLITQHIQSEIRSGSFTLLSFYEKRARRILPAAMAMLAAAAFAAWRLLYPADFVAFAKSLIAAVLYSSNFYFWATSSYFNGSSKPLLHTWSLAVEEQFYLVLPLVLMLLARRTERAVRIVLALVAAGSFLLSAATLSAHPDATFYLLPQRAWELLLGSLLAVGAIRLPGGKLPREVAAAAGLAAILISALSFTSQTPFPGPLALLPCGGAVLILAAGEAGELTLAGKALALPPLRAVGLISYSLYLWHLPIIAFAAYSTHLQFGHVFSRIFPFLSFAQAITMERIAALSAASIVAAALSWRFIEQPVRFGRLRPTRRVLFLSTALVSVVFVALATAAVCLNGLPGRFSSATLWIIAQSHQTVHYREGTCLAVKAGDFDAADCLRLDDSRPNWLLIGDSHAAHLYPGLKAEFPEIHILQMTILGCKPVPVPKIGETPACFQAMKAVYDSWLPGHRIAGVILAANWQDYDPPRISAAVKGMRELRQPVVVVGPVMHYDAPLPQLLAAQGEGSSGGLQMVEQHRITAYDQLDARMAGLAASEWKVPYFSLRSAFCNPSCMVWTAPYTPLQWDDSHLTDEGSRLAAEKMREAGFLR